MPPITGRMAFEGLNRSGLINLIGLGLGAELLYSFVIIVCSLMIYLGTKELYELSQHKGIKYFRMAFLFFAFAYFFRSFIKFVVLYFNVKGLFEISSRILNPLISQLTLIFFMYFSSMAIFYFLYSVMWKRWGNEKLVYLFHILAVVIALYSILSRSPFSYIGLNLVLFLFILIVVFISYKNSRKKSKGHNLYAIYVLLLFFWILNIVDILLPSFLELFQLFIYLISLGIFLLMVYKVLRKAGN